MNALFDEYGGSLIIICLGVGLLGGLGYVLKSLLCGDGDVFFESVVMRLLTS